MKALLYCVIRNDPSRPLNLQVELNGEALQLVSEKDLVAVISEIDDPHALPVTEAATRHHEVIARMHRERTVIPFRFGALLDGVADVKQLLRTHGDRFAKMLCALDGCVEMGLRIFVEEESLESSSDREEAQRLAVGVETAGIGPGTAYLTRRKSCYSRDLLVQRVTQRTTDEYATLFKGLWNEIACDRPRDCQDRGKGGVMISVYFLVPRDKEQRFRQAFLTLEGEKRSRILMTGPWPPYNFVVTNLGEKDVAASAAGSLVGPHP